MNFGQIKWILYGLVGAYAIYLLFFNNQQDTAEYSTSYESEEVVTPTQGLITTVTETEKDLFKIEDEVTVATPEESRIIARYMDETVDTFTLEEAKLAGADEQTRSGSIFRAASYGLLGYYMGRSMMGYRPRSSAYVDQNTYNRVTRNAGQSLQSTARRTTTSRPTAGKSGYGKTSGAKSTRSYGG